MTGFEEWRRTGAGAGFSEWLRQASEPDWAAVVGHRFVDELIAGRLDDAVMRRYLVQDYCFIDRLIALLGGAIACADRYAARIPLCGFAATLTGEANSYFLRAFDALGVPEAERTAPEEAAATLAFKALMDEARTSGVYPFCLTVLAVAEWSYLGWASRAGAESPPRFLHAEWIRLHGTADFRSFVGWLIQELDRVGPGLEPSAQRHCRLLFRRAVALERAFFDAAFG